MHDRLGTVTVTLLIIIIFMIGCSEDESSPSPVIAENSPPVVKSTSASPFSIPSNGTTILSCVATDDDGHTLTFAWLSADGMFPNGSNGTSVRWQPMVASGKATAVVLVSDGVDTVGAAVDLMVIEADANEAPSQPKDPFPAHKSDFMPVTSSLAWSCDDPDGDELTFVLYLSDDATVDSADYRATVTTTSWQPPAGELANDMKYYWKIVAYDGNGHVVESPVWTFRTEVIVIEQEFPLGDTGQIVKMAWIPPGSFMMGALPGEQGAYASEYPRHRVTISQGFWMGKYEVTQAQWEAVMGNWEFNFGYSGQHPAERMSYNDIRFDFIAAINAAELDSVWRLPTEAEWEYACRAGRDETRFWWGDDPEYVELDQYAWHGENTSGSTMPVGYKDPNPWGLFDMHGNVYEWCQDWYDPDYYSRSPEVDPQGPESGTDRVIRGGSWHFQPLNCRSANRYSYAPGYIIYFYFGFRLVRMGPAPGNL